MVGLSEFLQACDEIESKGKWDVEFAIAFGVIVIKGFEKKNISNQLKKSFSCPIEATQWVQKNFK